MFGTSDRIDCPHCGEIIRTTAVVCRWCRRPLYGAAFEAAAEGESNDSADSGAQSQTDKGDTRARREGAERPKRGNRYQRMEARFDRAFDRLARKGSDAATDDQFDDDRPGASSGATASGEAAPPRAEPGSAGAAARQPQESTTRTAPTFKRRQRREGDGAAEGAGSPSTTPSASASAPSGEQDRTCGGSPAPHTNEERREPEPPARPAREPGNVGERKTATVGGRDAAGKGSSKPSAPPRPADEPAPRVAATDDGGLEKKAEPSRDAKQPDGSTPSQAAPREPAAEACQPTAKRAPCTAASEDDAPPAAATPSPSQDATTSDRGPARARDEVPDKTESAEDPAPTKQTRTRAEPQPVAHPTGPGVEGRASGEDTGAPRREPTAAQSSEEPSASAAEEAAAEPSPEEPAARDPEAPADGPQQRPSYAEDDEAGEDIAARQSELTPDPSAKERAEPEDEALEPHHDARTREPEETAGPSYKEQGAPDAQVPDSEDDIRAREPASVASWARRAAQAVMPAARAKGGGTDSPSREIDPSRGPAPGACGPRSAASSTPERGPEDDRASGMQGPSAPMSESASTSAESRSRNEDIEGASEPIFFRGFATGEPEPPALIWARETERSDAGPRAAGFGAAAPGARGRPRHQPIRVDPSERAGPPPWTHGSRGTGAASAWRLAMFAVLVALAVGMVVDMPERWLDAVGPPPAERAGVAIDERADVATAENWAMAPEPSDGGEAEGAQAPAPDPPADSKSESAEIAAVPQTTTEPEPRSKDDSSSSVDDGTASALRGGDLSNVTATGELVAQVQSTLAQRGFDPGPVDGALGPQTRAAIRSFQRDAGVPEDGDLSHELLQHLGIAGPRIDPFDG